MDIRKRSIDFKVLAYICMILVVAFALFSFSFSTSYAMKDEKLWPHFPCLIAMSVFYLMVHISLLKGRKNRELFFFFVVDIFLLFFFLVFLFCGYEELIRYDRKPYVFSFVILIITFSIGIILCIQTIKSFLIEKIEHCKIDIPLAVLLFFGCILLLLQGICVPRWDGSILYGYINDLCLPNFFNLTALRVCGHVSLLYGAVNYMLSFALSNVLLAMWILEGVLYLVSIRSIYGVLKWYEGEKLVWVVLGTLIYECSPLILGISGNISYDYWLITIFPIMLYFDIVKENKLAFLFGGALLCFSKETGVLFFAGYCFGKLLYSFLEFQQGSVCYRLKVAIFRWETLGELFIGFVWLHFYMSCEQWGGAGSFTFSKTAMFNKLKVLYVLEFNWILFAFAIFYICYVCIKGQKGKDLKLLICLISADMLYVIFSCIYVTVNHARYIDSHASILILLGILGIGKIHMDKVRTATLAFLCLLLLVSNYYTLDPLTLISFENFSLGKRTVVSTCDGEYLSDSFSYNQQCKGINKAIDKAIDKALSQIELGVDEVLVCFDMVEGKSFFFEGMYQNGHKDEVMPQLWDRTSKKRVIEENKNCETIMTVNLTSDSDFDGLFEDYKYIVFLTIPSISDGLVGNQIEETQKVISRDEFKSKGCIITSLLCENIG